MGRAEILPAYESIDDAASTSAASSDEDRVEGGRVPRDIFIDAGECDEMRKRGKLS